MKKQNHGQFIIEYVQLGTMIKVSAVDPDSLREVSVAFPANKGLSRRDMANMAIKKLTYVLNKQAQEDIEAEEEDSSEVMGGDGIVV